MKQVSPKLIVNSMKKGRVSSKLNLKSHYLIFKNTLKQEGCFCGYTENAFTKLFFFFEKSPNSIELLVRKIFICVFNFILLAVYTFFIPIQNNFERCFTKR